MAGSDTKRLLIQRHAENALLHAPILPSARRSRRDLSVDQPSSSPDPIIVDGVMRALNEGQTHYVDVPGIAPLREKLAAFLAEMGLAGVAAGNVVVTAGVQEARFLTIQTIADSFGRIGLPAVVHPGTRQAVGVRRLEVDVLPVDPENGLLPTLAGLETALRAGCKLLYLESPGRLTGASYDSRAVNEIALMSQRFDARVIWDQGLAPWIEPAPYASLAAEPGLAERVAVLGEAWPGLGLESWFIGYVGADQGSVERIRSLKQVMSICTSTPSQYGALAAAELYADRHAARRAALARRREAAVTQAAAAGLRPLPGSVASLIALRAPAGAGPVAELAAAGFAVADGADFGAPGILRLAVADDDAIVAALAALTGSAAEGG